MLYNSPRDQRMVTGKAKREKKNTRKNWLNNPDLITNSTSEEW